jgi:signal transduction histidine kinase
MRAEEVRLLSAMIGSLLFVGALIWIFVVSMVRQYRLAIQLQSRNHMIRIEAEDSERRIIAADLHDDLGQRLIGASMMISSIRGESERTQNLVNEVTEHLSNIVDRLKDTSLKLAPPTLNRDGPLYAIESFKDLFLGRHSLKVTVEPIRCAKLSEAQAEHVYRMLQEILQNAMKHSQAKELRISALEEDGYLMIYTMDDGVGFVNDGRSRGSGLGNLKTRAQRIGAELVTETSPGKGTLYSIKIPYK